MEKKEWKHGRIDMEIEMHGHGHGHDDHPWRAQSRAEQITASYYVLYVHADNIRMLFEFVCVTRLDSRTLSPLRCPPKTFLFGAQAPEPEPEPELEPERE